MPHTRQAVLRKTGVGFGDTASSECGERRSADGPTATDWASGESPTFESAGNHDYSGIPHETAGMEGTVIGEG